MACGPQMVRRVLEAATHGDSAALGLIGRKPCVGDGRIGPGEEGRRRLRSLLTWLALAAFSVLAAVAILLAL